MKISATFIFQKLITFGLLLSFFTNLHAFREKIAWRGIVSTNEKALTSFKDSSSIAAVTGADTVAFDPLILNNTKNALPIILYLPGLDGVGSYSNDGFLSISNEYEVWKMSITADDRNTFSGLAAKVILFISNFPSPVILIGESFGGLLATYISLRAKSHVSKTILVNPATSFDKTVWPAVGNLISNAGPAFGMLGAATIAMTSVEPYQVQLFGRQILDRINSTEDALREIGELLESPNLLAQMLPPATLRWRLSGWIRTGVHLMSDKYSEITVPTLILIGSRDRLLPSVREGYRLQEVMTSTVVEVLEFPFNGHAMLDGSRNLSAILSGSRVFGTSPPEPPVRDFYPNPRDLQEVDRTLEPLFRGTSPVFLSRTVDGAVTRGLHSVPTGLSGRPVLFVGNHQLYGADLPLIIREFLKDKNTMVRGLTHPMIFEENPPYATPGQQNMSVVRDFLNKFGAVKVSPASLLELLKLNATVMLFPGGAREAYHYKGEAYKLFWPEKIDFVRLAAVYKAIIVPFAAIGMSESFNIVLDGDELLHLPLIGERFRRANKQLPQVRPGVVENLAIPISVPRLPLRSYFLFQKPFDTSTLNIYDKKASRELYKDIRGSVEDALDYLLRFRENDPYQGFIARSIYETTTGSQAPTAPLNSH